MLCAETVGNRLHVAVNGQGVWGTKRNLARVLNMEAGDIRVTNPDVGGGFGTKAMDYPETYLVAHAARLLGQADIAVIPLDVREVAQSQGDGIGGFIADPHPVQ